MGHFPMLRWRGGAQLLRMGSNQLGPQPTVDMVLGSGRRDGGNEREIPAQGSVSGSIEHTPQDCLLQEELLIWFGSVWTPDSFPGRSHLVQA